MAAERTGGQPRLPFWTRHLRREIQYLLDLAILIGVFVAAVWLRFENLPFQYLEQMPLVVMVQVAALFFAGIYSFVWRYVGMAELRSFVKAALISLALLLALRFGLTENHQAWRVPISVAIIDTVLAFGGLLGIRLLRRSLYESYERQAQVHPEDEKTTAKRTLLVGAGRAGVMAVRELVQQPRQGVDILGFLDDDPSKKNSIIQGVKVLGTTGELEEIVGRFKIERVLLTIVRAPRETLRKLVSTCKRLGVEVLIMPGLFDILEGRLTVFRKVQIEDVLGREAVRLEEDGLKQFLGGKCLLVTGAGGSIGSELARQCARYRPQRLTLVERSEPALFEIQQGLLGLWPDLNLDALVADIGNEERMRSILWDYRPQVVLHAAAHKHVPLMEQNPTEAVRNNALATHRLGQLVGELGVERFVLISTDKAVRPTSIMGASKRLAEIFIQGLDHQFETRFSAVRFGNVLESTGSVVPIFRKQIERGGPVMVTHPEMERYFMTIQEASQLVLHTATLGQGGEIFVLDMGKPVKILDLARDMIRLAGFEPDQEIEIQFSGPRPGEKLREELQLGPEQLDATRHPKISIGRLQPWEGRAISTVIEDLKRLVHEGESAPLFAFIKELLPEARLQAPQSKDGTGTYPTVAQQP
jgi:FlaA1/EpsC-like NDP-sugar epimerase